MHQIAYVDFSAIVIRTCLWQTAAAKSVSTVLYPPGNVWFMSDILFLLSLRYTERVHLPKPPKRDKLMMEHCPPSCTLPHIASVLCIFGQFHVLGLPALHGIKAKCKAKLTNIQQFSLGGDRVYTVGFTPLNRKEWAVSAKACSFTMNWERLLILKISWIRLAKFHENLFDSIPVNL